MEPPSFAMDGFSTGHLRLLRFTRPPVPYRAQKEVIVLSNGKNVYPEEIEAAYLKSPSSRRLP